MTRREEEYLIQQRLAQQLRRGQISRRQFMTRMMVAGLGLAGVGVASNYGLSRVMAQDERPLTPTFYQWIEDLHPSIPLVNNRFGDVNYQIAPVQGFGIERFVAEARNQESTWDVYVGVTPFVEMTALIEAGVIEPWNDYIPQEVIDDMIPAIRDEVTVDGNIYSWPFLLDITGMGWNMDIIEAAGLENAAPETWDEYLENTRTIVESGAALYGATFDAHGWRSLAPYTHSLSTDVYTEEGLFDFTSDAAIEALMLMKEIMQYSHPDILLEGATDGGVNGTPDEVAFAAQRVGYYTKYFNAPLRMAGFWPDPSRLALGGLPRFAESDGGTVFWTTGAALFRHGQNKERAAEYIRELTYDAQIWRDSIEGTETGQPGQLPPYQSIYDDWDASRPDWLPEFVDLIRAQFPMAKAIENHLFGLSQFVIGKPIWHKYLTGEVDNPMEVMEEVVEAVQAEMARQ